MDDEEDVLMTDFEQAIEEWEPPPACSGYPDCEDSDECDWPSCTLVDPSPPGVG